MSVLCLAKAICTGSMSIATTKIRIKNETKLHLKYKNNNNLLCENIPISCP